MRAIIGLAVVAAAAFLSACVFEAKAPLVAEADYITPLAPGAYTVLERKDSGDYEKNADAKVSLDKSRYTMTTPDGPMKFALYRVTPKIFIAQMNDEADQYMYALLETTEDGASITTLPCQQLNAAERARFQISQDSNSGCVFGNLDDLVTARLVSEGPWRNAVLKTS